MTYESGRQDTVRTFSSKRGRLANGDCPSCRRHVRNGAASLESQRKRVDGDSMLDTTSGLFARLGHPSWFFLGSDPDDEPPSITLGNLTRCGRYWFHQPSSVENDWLSSPAVRISALPSTHSLSGRFVREIREKREKRSLQSSMST